MASIPVSPAAQSPVGRPSLSSLSALTRWYGSGGPTLPYRVSPRGMKVLAQVPSVRPYPSIIGTPVTRSKFVRTAVGSVAAPTIPARRLEISTSSGSGGREAYTVGTVEKVVMR
ncbi:Uncharacterised protein [Mycobacteroides abscessus subsp. abscessus]|nr:Uncharacterised protein [Mycobacteroides abscessus subsp. abscessus]